VSVWPLYDIPLPTLYGMYCNIRDSRGETLDYAIVWVNPGGGGCPNKECLRIIVLILIQRLRTEQISCKGQVSVDTDRVVCSHIREIYRGVPI